jgi:hypothetical protein
MSTKKPLTQAIAEQEVIKVIIAEPATLYHNCFIRINERIRKEMEGLTDEECQEMILQYIYDNDPNVDINYEEGGTPYYTNRYTIESMITDEGEYLI